MGGQIGWSTLISSARREGKGYGKNSLKAYSSAADCEKGERSAATVFSLYLINERAVQCALTKHYSSNQSPPWNWEQTMNSYLYVFLELIKFLNLMIANKWANITAPYIALPGKILMKKLARKINEKWKK
jgi:hypothetical protein